MTKTKTRTLTVSAEIVRRLDATQLARVAGGRVVKDTDTITTTSVGAVCIGA